MITAGRVVGRSLAVAPQCSGQCRPTPPPPPSGAAAPVRGGGRDGRSGGSGGRGRGRGRSNNRRGPEVNEQQVSFAAPPRGPTPSVAIVGGGMSGLACGRALARRGVKAVVFDTGEHSVGGRMATRATATGSYRRKLLPGGDGGDGGSDGSGGGGDGDLAARLAAADLRFDHAAQFFTATDARCGATTADAQGRGVLPANGL